MRWMAATYGSLRALMIAMVAGHGGPALAQGGSPDDQAWEAARASGTVEACQQYLTEFPTGDHAEDAFRCLVEGSVSNTPGSGQPAAVDIY